MKKLTFLFRVPCGTALALASLGLTLVLSSASRGLAEDDQPAAEGLRGILPAEVPLGLLEDDFLSLGESWEKWSIGVAAEVAKLYEDEELDVAAQKATLTLLRKKLGTMEKALADRRYRSIFHPLSSMHSRLNRRVTMAEAILETFDQNPDAERASQVDVARQDVVEALDDLDSWLTNDIRNGRPWLKYVKADEIRALVDGDMPMDVVNTVQIKLASVTTLNDAQRNFLQRARFVRLRESLDTYETLRTAAARFIPAEVDMTALRGSTAKLIESLETWEETRTEQAATNARAAYETLRGQAADDGKRIGDALSNHYFNFNLRIVASEKFLNKVVGYNHKDEGPVNDIILGARVSGSQTTNGRVGIDLRPNNDNVFFYMTFGGVTQSRTRGVTDEATIFTSGYHEFNASKGITFNGDKFSVADARISVNANNNTTGARTGVSGIPLFGSIADSYAVSEARRRKSQSEAIAAQKLRARLLPEFNREVNKEFEKYSELLEGRVNPKLHETGLFPTARSFRSTDDELWVSTRLMNESELGGDSPTFTTTTSRGVAIHMHESLINNALERLPLRGRELTESDIALELSNVISNLLGKEVKLGGDEDGEADPTQFLFPTDDVMRVEINDGELVIVLRTGLRPKDGEEIPTQEIRVPLTFAIDGDDIVIEAGSVDVFPVEPASSLKQLPRARIVSAKIKQALPTRKLDRFIDLKRKQGGPVKLAISEIRPNAGWLSIVIE